MLNKFKVVTPALALATALFGSAANAAFISGELVMVYSDNTTTWAYVKPSNFYAIPTYVWACSTIDPELGNRIHSNLHKTVQVNTTANCATSGQYRGCGTCSNYYAD